MGPPALRRVRDNPTEYIERIEIDRVPGPTIAERWFDQVTIDLNPGLIAVIGNKGNGKSALADTIGHLGHTRQHEAFSFLNPQKFRTKKRPLADKFAARIFWRSGDESSRRLDADFDASAIETVKYIPQSYLERVCNDKDITQSDSFERELEDVIFSHIPTADRLGKSSLSALIKLRTDEAEKRIDLLRAQLNEFLVEIVRLEDLNTE